jgi:hypothetical protein
MDVVRWPSGAGSEDLVPPGATEAGQIADAAVRKSHGRDPTHGGFSLPLGILKRSIGAGLKGRIITLGLDQRGNGLWELMLSGHDWKHPFPVMSMASYHWRNGDRSVGMTWSARRDGPADQDQDPDTPGKRHDKGVR